jgi:hypothetical protein
LAERTRVQATPKAVNKLVKDWERWI